MEYSEEIIRQLRRTIMKREGISEEDAGLRLTELLKKVEAKAEESPIIGQFTQEEGQKLDETCQKLITSNYKLLSHNTKTPMQACMGMIMLGMHEIKSITGFMLEKRLINEIEAQALIESVKQTLDESLK